MPTTLESLPDEILSEVFSYFESVFIVPPTCWTLPRQYDRPNLPSKKTLRNLALASKRISRLSQPSLYKHLILQEEELIKLGGQDDTPFTFGYIAGSGSDGRFGHVRELEVDLYRYNLPIITLPPSLKNVTRLILVLHPDTGYALSGLAASLQKLQFIKLSQIDIEGQPGDVEVFLSRLVSLDLKRRSAGKHIRRLSTLELEAVDLHPLSSELVEFAQHFSISALSLWNRYLEDFSLSSLHDIQTNSKLSLDSAGTDHDANLEGLDNLAHLEILRIGYMHRRNPAVIFRALPHQIRILQIMYQNHSTLDALFSSLAARFLPSLEVLELQEVEELAADPTGVSVYGVPDDALKTLYSAYMSACVAALDVMRDQGVRVIPPNLSELLEGCVIGRWGEGWRLQTEPAEGSDKGQASEAGNSEDEEIGEA